MQAEQPSLNVGHLEINESILEASQKSPKDRDNNQSDLSFIYSNIAGDDVSARNIDDNSRCQEQDYFD